MRDDFDNSEGLGEMVDRVLKVYFEAHEGELPAAGLYKRFHEIVDRPLILRSLAATGGNQIKAAALLGVNRNTLRKKMKMLDIQIVKERS